jgi:hypothetical protein
MSPISRRTLITSGLAVTAGVAGLAAATRVAERYGLVPPDGGGLYGPGETLTYAALRSLTSHSLAREFPRSMISQSPFANEVAGGWLCRLAPRSGWHGRAPHFVFAGRSEKHANA